MSTGARVYDKCDLRAGSIRQATTRSQQREEISPILPPVRRRRGLLERRFGFADQTEALVAGGAGFSQQRSRPQK